MPQEVTVAQRVAADDAAAKVAAQAEFSSASFGARSSWQVMLAMSVC